ncbi:hypothetical protein BDV18DRAFT_132512 [Aspergillus unguis]
MAPTQSTPTSWKSLLLTTFAVLAFSPLATSLPLALRHSSLNPETTSEGSLQARSPDPRMIPSQTDLLSAAFASLGMQELSKLNQLNQEQHEKETELETELDNAQQEMENNSNSEKPVDDSHSAQPTVTTHESQMEQESPTPSSMPSSTPSPTPCPKTGAETEGESKGQDDEQEPKDAKDAVKDENGFMDELFQALRKKFREALNSADEIQLR